jgi:hypothetical protein
MNKNYIICRDELSSILETMQVQLVAALIGQLQESLNKKGQEDCEILSMSEAMNFLRISKNTLLDRMRKGSIEYFKNGKRTFFTRQSLVNFINANTHGK